MMDMHYVISDCSRTKVKLTDSINGTLQRNYIQFLLTINVHMHLSLPDISVLLAVLNKAVIYRQAWNYSNP